MRLWGKKTTKRRKKQPRISMHSVPFNCKISLAKRSGTIKFSCGFLSAKALFFCREGGKKKKRREKSLGLSCESKSVGKSMGPSGKGRRQLCGARVQDTLLQKGPSLQHLQNTSELRLPACSHCSTQSTGHTPAANLRVALAQNPGNRG